MCELRRLDSGCLVEIVREGSLNAVPRHRGQALAALCEFNGK